MWPGFPFENLPLPASLGVLAPFTNRICWSANPPKLFSIAMPSHHLPNYLRAHRKRLSLYQNEVAFLLGVGSGTKASRYERSSRIPGLETVLAYEAIFGRPVSELFAGLYGDVHKLVAHRAKRLERKLMGQPRTPQNLRKLRSLQTIMARHASGETKPA